MGKAAKTIKFRAARIADSYQGRLPQQAASRHARWSAEADAPRDYGIIRYYDKPVQVYRLECFPNHPLRRAPFNCF